MEQKRNLIKSSPALSTWVGMKCYKKIEALIEFEFCRQAV